MKEIQDWVWIGLDLTINLILLVGSFLFRRDIGKTSYCEDNIFNIPTTILTEISSF